MADNEEQVPESTPSGTGEATPSSTGEGAAPSAIGEVAAEATGSSTGETAQASPSATDASVVATEAAPSTTDGLQDKPESAEAPAPAAPVVPSKVPSTTTSKADSGMVSAQSIASTESKKSDTKLKKKSSTARKKGAKVIDLETAKIGIIGAGKMCEAIVDGLINFGKIAANRIYIAAPSARNTDRYKQQGCQTTKRNIDIFARFDTDIQFLCFHGGVIKYCYKLGGSRPHPITTNYIPNMKHPICILSMVSGVSLDQIKAVLLNPEHPKQYQLEIHRVMVNAACAYGLGVCAIDVEPDSSHLSAPIRTLLSSIGRLEHVPESQMDAACAIGGNGLAFGYYFMNAMADGAFKMGLSRVMAIKFAAKTVQCGAQCLLESGRHPSELRDAVSAAGGPAIYGIHVLDKADVASGIQAAVEAAYRRAGELAETEVVSS